MQNNNLQNTNSENRTTSQKVRDFIRYNNSVPLFVAIGIVVSGSAFAATPAGQQTLSQTLVGAESRVVSVDNTLIASKDLSSWSPKARVTGVKEDADNYYVDYVFSTIDIVNYKWIETDKNMTLRVQKEILKDYKSLSDYVQFQLKENIVAESDRLARTQEIEKKNITQMQTVTTYTGLAGLILDENTVVADPVAPAPESKTPGIYVPPVVPVQIPNTETPTVTDPVTPTETVPTPVVTASTTPTTTTPIIDTTLLDNPATTTASSTEATNTPQITEPIVNPTPGENINATQNESVAPTDADPVPSPVVDVPATTETPVTEN